MLSREVCSIIIGRRTRIVLKTLVSDPYLAIRTFSSTSISEVEMKQNNVAFGKVRLVERANILPSDVGHRPIVDVKLFRSQPITGIVVNDAGDVYNCDVHNERATT